MSKIFLVGAGGFIGSVLRYAISIFIVKFFEKPVAHFGTLAINVLGCLMIGFLGGLSETRNLFNPETRLLVFIGFLGGFTTFSTFGYEVFSFTRDGQLLASMTNLSMHMILGLGAVWLGNEFSKML